MQPVRRGFAVLVAALIGLSGALPARACIPELAVIDLATGKTRLSVPADRFTLVWRHSVSLTQVEAEYVGSAEHGLVQVSERLEAHGPGVEYGGDGWIFEKDHMVLHLNRVVPRLILRAAPEHENRLVVAGQAHDLTRWPGTPLEIEMRACKERQE